MKLEMSHLSAEARAKLKELVKSGQIFHSRRFGMQKPKRTAPFKAEQVEIYGEDTSNAWSVRRD